MYGDASATACKLIGHRVGRTARVTPHGPGASYGPDGRAPIIAGPPAQVRYRTVHAVGPKKDQTADRDRDRDLGRMA